MHLRREPFGKAHFAFLLTVGTASWLLLILGTWLEGWPVGGSGPVSLDNFALFLTFCLIARFLAFDVMQRMAISLDSAFYIAAIWTLGPLTAAWVAVIVALLIDGFWRTFRREFVERTDRRPWKINIAHIFYGAGAVGAQFLLVGWIVQVEAVRQSIGASPATAQWWVVGTIPFLTLLFLALNYGTGGLNLWIQGHTALEIRDGLLRHGVVAECLQIPLSMAVVQVFDPNNHFNFVLLGTTFLLINAVFKKLTQASASLRQRVNDLTTLNDLGRAMSSTLQLDELMGKIAGCTLPVMEHAEVLSIWLSDEKTNGLRVRAYARDHSSTEEVVPRGEGIAGWVVQNKMPLLVHDLVPDSQLLGVRIGEHEHDVRSWLGVPLVVYDETIGILSVQSAARSAFTMDHQRLLESIGQQAAVAIQNARLYELATVDGLTQLYVRRYFDLRLDEEWRRSTRYHNSFAIILIDLDDFKLLNDRYGHQVGDRVLRETAGIVRRKMRGVDIPARYGGEEYAILLPRASNADAAKVANRIRADIAAYRLRMNGTELGVTASFGVASYPECGDVDAVEVLHRADLALYEAKETGKNRVCVFRADERGRVQAVP
jgi:diguanylate cyclase (GGDEF)-like protein